MGDQQTEFGYTLKEGERFITGNEFAGIIVLYRDEPTKLIYPDGRIVPVKKY